MKPRSRIKRLAAETLFVAMLFYVFPLRATAQASTPTSIKTAIALARGEISRGDLSRAETALWTVLSDNPNDPDALTLLGTIRGRQQRYPEAEVLFKRVLEINSNSLEAHRGLAAVLIAENRSSEALEQYQAAMTLAPSDLRLKTESAHVYAGRGQFQEALSLLQTIPPARLPADAVSVKAASLLALGKSMDAKQVVEMAKSSPAAELDLAEVFLNANLPDPALYSLEFAAQVLKKRSARFYYLQGRALQLKGRSEAGLASLKQAVAADPNSADSHVALAEISAARNQHGDAVKELQKALAITPDNIIVLRHLVVEATKSGDGQVALDAATALAAKSPDNPDDLYLASAAMLQQNFSGASAVLEKYVVLRSDNAKGWLGLGLAYVQQRKYAEARAPLERALKLDPKIAEAEYQLGLVAKNSGTSDEAIQHFTRAVDLQPKHVKALWSLGNLYLQSGELQKARENLQSAEALDPKSVETEYDLGLVLTKMGKPELAREHFDRYRKLKEDQPPADRDAR